LHHCSHSNASTLTAPHCCCYLRANSADIVNGKAITTSFVAQNLGAQAGLQTRANSSSAAQVGWTTSSATISVELNAGKGSSKSIQNTLVQSFNPYKGMSASGRQSYLSQIEAATRGGTAYSTTPKTHYAQLSRRIIAPYMMATHAWAHDDEQPSQSSPGILLSRGVLIDPVFTDAAVVIQVRARCLHVCYVELRSVLRSVQCLVQDSLHV
jgi:hypothetical protein